jgi:uncharacterized surface protein with fasciclin (FAS1) repeats
MLKKYFNSSDERLLKEQSHTMFKEISSGVYHVVKDRADTYHEFVNSEEIVRALNHSIKIAVTSNSGIYANFEMEKQKPYLPKKSDLGL